MWPVEFQIDAMNQALALAEEARSQGEVPVGAVVVNPQGQIIGRGYNLKESKGDATLHAEIIALRDAAKSVGGWRLKDCDLFVTLEPCLMCCGAILQSRVRAVYFGAKDPKGGAAVSLLQTLEDSRFNHTCQVLGGVLETPCAEILKEFFAEIRLKATRKSF